MRVPHGPNMGAYGSLFPFAATEMTPEQQAVLRSVRKLVDFWQIEPHELAPDRPLPPVAPARPSVPAGPKYKHPRNGVTWDGEGTQPPWLREALTKEGYTVDELRIAGTADKALGEPAAD